MSQKPGKNVQINRFHAPL